MGTKVYDTGVNVYVIGVKEYGVSGVKEYDTGVNVYVIGVKE